MEEKKFILNGQMNLGRDKTLTLGIFHEEKRRPSMHLFYFSSEGFENTRREEEDRLSYAFQIFILDTLAMECTLTTQN